MDIYLCGMLTAGNWVAAAIFLKFWRHTRDRFFLYFAFAFIVFGLSRMPRAFLDPTSHWAIYTYVVRLAGYASILAAIIDKNLKAWQGPSPASPEPIQSDPMKVTRPH